MLHWILTIKFYVDFAIRNNNNVDINFSVYDVFLESPSSGTLKVERLEKQII
jgi:hypothetical protein